ncbi:MAG: TIGR03790 family protein [Planctomycetes bacterium]|nr:TIGR03790 family protein [Planctomycetota bacterium]
MMRRVLGCILPMALLLSVTLSSAIAASASPGPARVLIIYNANWTGDEDGDGVQDSLQVANYYQSKRGVPVANMLGLSCNDWGYDDTTYSAFHSEVVTPIKNKLNSLGATSIDILLMCYRTPLAYRDRSLDNVLMGLNYWSTTSDNIYNNYYNLTNPYLDASPTFGAANGFFDHANFTLGGTQMYLVGRLDGPMGVRGALNLVDQALYGERFISAQPGYYNGNIYVDSQNRKGTATDANLTADPDVQNGTYWGYTDTDVNIAYGEHYVLPTGLPLKWEQSGSTIGDAGLTYTDGSNASSAPRALMYGGWYNYNTYKPVFEWLPGSVACDLNSSSLITWWIRNEFSLAWAANAQKAGATCVCGVAGEPYTLGHTRPNVLLYYMLNGYTFAEASCAANPCIAWMSYALGDPLYAPMRAKTPVLDTVAPNMAVGSPAVTMPVNRGSTVGIVVADAAEPEVARARIEWGTSASYGQSFTSTGYFKRHALTFPELPSDTVIHYRVILTDPVGNSTTSGDFTFRSPAQNPYAGSVNAVPGIFQAENFDEGGEGIAYHDREPSNWGTWQFRPDTGVEIYSTSDPGTAGRYVGNCHAGEWYEYTIDVATTGTYSLDVIFGDFYDSRGSFHVDIDGTNRTGALVMSTPAPNTSGWFAATTTGISLSAGRHVMRLVVDSPEDVGDFDRFNFTLTGSTGDVTPPVISAVASSSITTSGATISWTTDEASDSLVQYGTTASYGNSSTLNAALVTAHSVALSGLSASTLYHYRVLSRDAAGNLATSGDFTFTTATPADTTAPVITAVTATAITATGSTITWTTNEASSTQVQYGTTTSYGSSSTLNSSQVTSHSAALSGLTASTLYHYRVLSRDAAGNLATSGDYTFTTSPAPDTTAPVISSITVGSITASAAVVSWSTNEASDSQVQYGITTAYGSSTVLNTTKVTAHSVALSGLTANTLYHLRVLSRDAAGNLATSGDVTFTTTSAPDTTAPVLSAITAVAITASGATITWTSNEASDTQVQFGATTAYGSATTLNAAMTTAHTQALSGLLPSTLYHYRVLSRDAAGNLATSGDRTFTTSAPSTSSTSSDAGDEDGRHQPNRNCGIGTGGLLLLALGLTVVGRRTRR